MYECIVEACSKKPGSNCLLCLCADIWVLCTFTAAKLDRQRCTCTHRMFYPTVWYVMSSTYKTICIRVCWTWVLLYIVYHKVDSFRQQWLTAALSGSTSLERKTLPTSQPTSFKLLVLWDLISEGEFKSVWFVRFTEVGAHLDFRHFCWMHAWIIWAVEKMFDWMFCTCLWEILKFQAAKLGLRFSQFYWQHIDVSTLAEIVIL